jgi:hypothetical protein
VPSPALTSRDSAPAGRSGSSLRAEGRPDAAPRSASSCPV